MIPSSRRRFVCHILLLVFLPCPFAIAAASHHDSLAFVPVCSIRRQVVSTHSRCHFSPINIDHHSLTTRLIATTPDEDTPVPIGSSSATPNTTTDPTRPSSTTTTTTLNFWEHMMCGATSRSLAKTIFHPANVAKTILQTSPDTTVGALVLQQPSVLLRGTAAQFVLSAIQGAVSFAIVEQVRQIMGQLWQQWQRRQSTETSTTTAASLDFASSVVSTLAASIVSVPQMVLMDNLMAGNYPNLGTAVSTLYNQGGVGAFYTNWGPHLVGKIPAYAFTWVFFQQLKRLHNQLYRSRTPTAAENTGMGFLASAASVLLMMPVEVVKTRMVTQSVEIPYHSMMDGFNRVVREEGWLTLYRGLVPRLVSSVPMTGVNFGVYETLKRIYLDTKRARVSSEKAGVKPTEDGL